MKANLKDDWFPKWFKNLPAKHHKENGMWMHWKRPSPAKDPELTNHERVLMQRKSRGRIAS